MTQRPRRQGRVWATGALLAVAIGAFGMVIDRLPGTKATESAAETGTVASVNGPDKVNFDRLFELGIDALRTGDAHAAARAFEAARQRQPHVPEVYVNLGFAYLALGQPAAAKSAFESAIGMRTGQTNAFFGLAESNERLGDIEGALGAMRTYVHLAAPDDRYRRKAAAAIWEWQSEIDRKRAAADTAGPAVPADVATPLGAIAADATRVLGSPQAEVAIALASDKTVIVNVWATWCAPCRAEMPSLQRLRDRLDPARFELIGLSVDKDPDFVREFLRDVGITYTNYVDSGQRIAGAVLDVRSFPQTLVIEPGGAVVARFVGAREWDDPAIMDQIARRIQLP